MGKKKSAAKPAPKKVGKTKEFSCPECKRPSCVKVHVKKQQIDQKAECQCTLCGANYNMFISLMENDKNAYMHWISYLRERDQYGVQCPEKHEKGPVDIVIRDGTKQGHLFCPRCSAHYYCELQNQDEDRRSLVIRMNRVGGVKYLDIINEQGILRKKAAKKQQKEQSESSYEQKEESSTSEESQEQSSNHISAQEESAANDESKKKEVSEDKSGSDDL